MRGPNPGPPPPGRRLQREGAAPVRHPEGGLEGVYLIASTMLWSGTQGGVEGVYLIASTMLWSGTHKDEWRGCTLWPRPCYGPASIRRLPVRPRLGWTLRVHPIDCPAPHRGGCQTISWRGVHKEVDARPYHGAASTRRWMPDHIMARRPQGGGCRTISWRGVHKEADARPYHGGGIHKGAACPPQPPVQHPPQASRAAQRPHYDNRPCYGPASGLAGGCRRLVRQGVYALRRGIRTEASALGQHGPAPPSRKLAWVRCLTEAGVGVFRPSIRTTTRLRQGMHTATTHPHQRIRTSASASTCPHCVSTARLLPY
jgi:hypothetical protein